MICTKFLHLLRYRFILCCFTARVKLNSLELMYIISGSSRQILKFENVCKKMMFTRSF